MGIFQGKFKVNARAFGGAGLFLAFLIIIIPIWAGVLETGIVSDIPSNLVQTEEGARQPIFTHSATLPLLVLMVGSFIAFVFLYRAKRKRGK